MMSRLEKLERELTANERFGLTAIDAEGSIQGNTVVFASSARTVKITKGAAIDGGRAIVCCEREDRSAEFTFGETLHKTTLFGRTRLLFGGIRIFFDMDRGGRP